MNLHRKESKETISTIKIIFDQLPTLADMFEEKIATDNRLKASHWDLLGFANKKKFTTKGYQASLEISMK
jgi:hypothetical protein